MVANVTSVTAVQKNSSAPQTSHAASGSSGMSFNDMLHSEIHASTPANPANHATAAHVANNAGTAKSTTATSSAEKSNGDSAKTGTAPKSAVAGTGVKKISKPDQTQAASTADQTAAAAIAATLAAVASNPANIPPAQDPAASTAAAVSAGQSATPADQAAMLAGSAADSAAANQMQNLNPKTSLGTNPLNADDAKPTTALVPGQNGVSANFASGNLGKSIGQQSGEFAGTLNQAMNQELTATGKSGSNQTSVPLAQSESALASTNTISANNPIEASLPLQTLKTANENLSAAQFNAIAPVLTMPNPGADAAKPTDTIAPQVGSPDWDQAIGQKITWMVNGGQQTASLTLNPPELGPMQVVLSVNNQHANATFISHQPEVRAALESAIPKLREMMGMSGIQLGECNVNSQARQQEFAQNQSGSNTTGSAGISGNQGNVSIMSSNTVSTSRAGIGLVDTFV